MDWGEGGEGREEGRWWLFSQLSTYMLYAFFWVIPRRLNFIRWRFRTLCQFHLHRLHTGYPPTKTEQSVPKCRHIKFRHRRITQEKACNIQNKVKDWNQEFQLTSYLMVSKVQMTNQVHGNRAYVSHTSPFSLSWSSPRLNSSNHCLFTKACQ
jgi:hypothetical protein